MCFTGFGVPDLEHVISPRPVDPAIAAALAAAQEKAAMPAVEFKKLYVAADAEGKAAKPAALQGRRRKKGNGQRKK
jgi:hypothetical protein